MRQTPFPEKWVPIAYKEVTGKVEWICAGEIDFTEPFFDDSVKVLKRVNRDIKSTTSSELLAFYDRSLTEAIPPTAFIFHVSRCGSTLVTQMLAQSARNIVYSEPPVLDDILCSNLDRKSKTDLLQAALAAMGQKRKEHQKYLFIKWDSWHLGFYGLIKATFPRVPVLFLYRHPLDVLKSHYQMRGMQMVPGLLKKNVFNIEDIPVYDLDAYSAAVLSKLFDWMMAYRKDTTVQLVNRLHFLIKVQPL